jgi:ectoine hydroxylase-related dioxygenase (phytanoyl-CoA dioxygenase family)
MSTDVLTKVTEQDVEAYGRDGAVCVRRAFPYWAQQVAAGVEKNLAEPSPYAKFYTPKGNPGSFFGDYCNWSRIPEFREFVLHSPAAAIAGRMMGSRTVRIFHDHLLVKEPGTQERTPWHHDQPYYCVDGTQLCSIWMPLDGVARDTCVEYVAGSHRWGQYFTPRRFVDHQHYDYAPGAYPSVPDIDAEREKYRILAWDLEPGDCIVFHGLTLHGAPGNLSLERRRRRSPRAGSETTPSTPGGRGRPRPPSPSSRGSSGPATRWTTSSFQSSGAERSEAPLTERRRSGPTAFFFHLDAGRTRAYRRPPGVGRPTRSPVRPARSPRPRSR